MVPFLKWAGGKRWLTKLLADKIPSGFNRYIEPFLGSGAIFFELMPSSAILSDVNGALIDTYRTVRDYPDDIARRLGELHHSHTEAVYYLMRASRPNDPIEAAARFIYLNRTCWNGLYRVNRKDEFNVPIGTKTAVLLSSDNFPAISNALNNAIIKCCDFEDSVDAAESGDLIYVDPPYTVKHNLNGFVKYNQTMFSWDDQIRLRDSLKRARDRGCSIIVSNADHKSIRDLYADFELKKYPRSSVIAGRPFARGQTTELLVVHHG